MASFETVKNKYKTLRFNSIASSLDTLVNQAEGNEISYLRFAEILADHELRIRDENRIRLNMKRAAFPVIKQLAEFDFSFQTTITKRQITSLLDFTFIDNRQSIVFIGPPGVGNYRKFLFMERNKNTCLF
jgi:DNA replication protein DnaC